MHASVAYLLPYCCCCPVMYEDDTPYSTVQYFIQHRISWKRVKAAARKKRGTHHRSPLTGCSCHPWLNAAWHVLAVSTTKTMCMVACVKFRVLTGPLTTTPSCARPDPSLALLSSTRRFIWPWSGKTSVSVSTKERHVWNAAKSVSAEDTLATDMDAD
jgi:hypothetical protein